MARKAVQGYPEKSLYDNTRYLGILATTDPLNEGVFRLLVNFDISDTGQSLIPREGFLTTGITNVTLSDRVVIFRDNGSDAHIVYDFVSNKGYIVDLSRYNIEDKQLPYTKEIVNINWTLGSLQDVEVPEDIHVEYITDENLIKYALVKVKINDSVCSLGIHYNEKTDTLYFDPIEYNQNTSYYSHLRNIASLKSIIPDPMQKVYKLIERPDGFVNTVGLTYVKDFAGRYAINFVEHDTEYTFIPHFELNPPSIAKTNATDWAVSIEITSTSTDDVLDKIYRVPWFDLVSRNPLFNVDSTYIAMDSDTPVKDRHYQGAQKIITLVKNSVFDTTPMFGSFPNKGRNELFPTLKPPSERTRTYIGTAYKEEYDLQDKLKAIKTTEDMIAFIEHAESINYRFVIGDTTEAAPIEGDNGLQSLMTINNYNDFSAYTIWENPEGTTSDQIFIGGKGFSISRYIGGNIKQQTTYHWLPSKFSDNGTAYDPTKDVDKKVTDHILFDDNTANNTIAGSEVVRLIKAGVFNSMGILVPIVFRILSIKAKCKKYISDDAFLPGYIYTNTKHLLGADAGNGVGSVSSIYPLTLVCLGFTVLPDNPLVPTLGTPIQITTETLREQIPDKFFENGYLIRYYFYPYNKNEIDALFAPLIQLQKIKLLETSFLVQAGTRFTSVASVSFTEIPSDITYIEEEYTEHAGLIQNSNNYIVYNENILITWDNNRLYISQPNQFYYFKEENYILFDEKIVKVLQYKNILLVFTVQHLYAVYEQEVQSPPMVKDGPPIISYVWSKQKVLYNILVDDKYKDTIQIFNQMVLFYSSEGQLYLIKPNTMIDSETRFTLQILNKSANDILANYVTYINERLLQYGKEEQFTNDDVEIKATVTISEIKIYYSVPGYITMILIFDIIANRFYLYDTLSFTKIYAKMFVDSGEVLVVRDGWNTLFTLQHTETDMKDNNVDMNILTDFTKEPVQCLIDTGNLNLNNHLRKRFKDLRLTFKNLNANTVDYKVDGVVDDIEVVSSYQHSIEVKYIDGTPTFVDEIKDVSADIINNDLLLDFSNYLSNALLTHRTSIMSVGKVMRLKLMFSSKGKYKVQDYSIVYKERRL